MRLTDSLYLDIQRKLETSSPSPPSPPKFTLFQLPSKTREYIHWVLRSLVSEYKPQKSSSLSSKQLLIPSQRCICWMHKPVEHLKCPGGQAGGKKIQKKTNNFKVSSSQILPAHFNSQSLSCSKE